jgi:glycosyltransferase involved in cell wall biosynthesis
MKICLIGVFSGNLDEGYKNIAFNLSKNLSKGDDVLNMDVKGILSSYFWKEIKEFKPHIIHYLTAPTLSSFIALRITKIYCNRDMKLVISSLHPVSLKILRNPVLKRCISLFKPNLILTQSCKVDEVLRDIDCNAEFLPNGVATERFVPASENVKEKLRHKYGIDKEKFVILHVGHLRGVRGLQIFNKLQREDKNTQVVIVGSSYFRTDKKLRHDLVKSGCIVWDKYFEKLEEVYALSDCYVFPVIMGNSIFMPLSVLEAMSCNLPVISTKFEGLSRSFEEGEGLFFVEKEEDFYKRLREVRSEDLKADTRRKVLPYSWENVGRRLESIYNNLLSDE